MGSTPTWIIGAIVTENEHLLSCLAEECNEVAQRVSKALRFGLNEIQPGQPLTNAQRISLELTDLCGVVTMLLSRNLIVDVDPAGVIEKQAKIEKFMKYARELGTIQDK